MSLGVSFSTLYQRTGEKCKRILCPYRHSEMKRNSIFDKEIDDLEISEKMENDNTADENISFTTSTPKKDSLNESPLGRQVPCGG